MLLMLLLILGKNQNVIQKDKNKILQHVTKYIINYGLQKGWCITFTKRHHLVFIVTTGFGEGHFPLIPLADANQMLYIPEIVFQWRMVAPHNSRKSVEMSGRAICFL